VKPATGRRVTRRLAWAGDKRHTAPDSASRLAHCWATSSGCRRPMLARQGTPSLIRDVAVVQAVRETTES
jgi:hypothetical protein